MGADTASRLLLWGKTKILLRLCRWQVGPENPHQRTDNGLQADQWSYNIPVPGGAIYAAQVSLLQGKITVPYTGTLSLLLVTGGNVTLPVQGVYQGTTYAPAVSHSLYQRLYEDFPHYADLTRQSAD